MAKGDLNDKPSPMTQQSQSTMGQTGIPGAGSTNSIMQRAQTTGLVPQGYNGYNNGVQSGQNQNQMGQTGIVPYSNNNPGFGGIPFMGMQGINQLIQKYPMLASRGYNGMNNSFAQQNPFGNGQMPMMKYPQMGGNQPSIWQGSAGNGQINSSPINDSPANIWGSGMWGGMAKNLMGQASPSPGLQQAFSRIGDLDPSKSYADYQRDYWAPDRDQVLQASAMQSGMNQPVRMMF